MGLRVFYEFASKPIRNVIMKMMKQFLVPALFGIALSAPMASAQITLNPISTSQNGVPADLYDGSAAEIVKFDPVTQRMYVVNGFADAIDIFDVSDPSDPVLFRSVDLSAYGNPNSVDVHPVAKLDQVAVAVGSGDATVRGSVVFLNKNGDFLRQLQVGYLPDMLTYGRRVATWWSPTKASPMTTTASTPWVQSASSVPVDPMWRNTPPLKSIFEN